MAQRAKNPSGASIIDGPSKRTIALKLFERELLQNAWVDFKIETGEIWAVVIRGAQRDILAAQAPQDRGDAWVLKGYAGHLVGRNHLGQRTFLQPDFLVEIKYNTRDRKGKFE